MGGRRPFCQMRPALGEIAMSMIGIDLGITSSLACVCRGGKAELIPSELGQFRTPSAAPAPGSREPTEPEMIEARESLLRSDPDEQIGQIAVASGIHFL